MIFFFFFLLLFCCLYWNEHIWRERKAAKEEEKDLGNHPRNGNYIHRSLWFRVLFVVSVCLARAEVWGSQQWQWSSPGLTKWIKLNDWQWLKPHRAWGKLRGPRLRSARPPCLRFYNSRSFFQKRKLVCYTNVAHGIHARRSALTPRRAGYHPMRTWANNDVARSNTPKSSSGGCCRPIRPPLVMFVNLKPREKCVMFSSVFSRYLCERPWIE